MTRLLIIGITGRMGQAIQRLSTDESFEVIAGIATDKSPAPGVPVFTPEQMEDPSTLVTVAGKPEIIIDFSGISGFNVAMTMADEWQIPLVSGSTGLSDSQIRSFLQLSSKVPVLLGSNMSLGVNLLLHLLPGITEALGEQYDVEISEIHHNQKKDAPSGTAIALQEAVQTGTFRASDDVLYGRAPETAPRNKDEIAVHALRGGDVVGDHTVFFFGPGERLELTHRAHSRDTFARGALRAARYLMTQPSGRYTMRDVLGIK